MYKILNHRKKINLVLALLTLLFVQCSSVKIPVYQIPSDWENLSKRDSVINVYSKYLSGKKVFLDPGHGGEDRKNTNSTGEIVEADLNVRIGVALKQYLEQAGVTVFISRDKDATVPLAYRSELANKSGADIFISIHHNAPGGKNESINYTSTYYHAKETDYEYEPCERDLARYLQRDLAFVMGNSGGLGSFDGTYSDYFIYPGEGFSVLRKTTIPSVLLECAYHTSKFEYFRLNNEEFNQIQAWGIFKGLGKYYRAGLPLINILSDSSKIENQILKTAFELKDPVGIDHYSIRVYLNKEEVEFKFDKKLSILSINLGLLPNQENLLRIVCANKNGNHALPFHRKISINGNSEIKILE